MNYIPRPGIVRTKLCDSNVLIPSRLAARECQSILQLNFFGTVVWTAIEKDQPMEKVLGICRILTKKPDEELVARIEAFCEKLVEMGYALPKPASPVQPASEDCL